VVCRFDPNVEGSSSNLVWHNIFFGWGLIFVLFHSFHPSWCLTSYIFTNNNYCNKQLRIVLVCHFAPSS
jgi:hypothetical protein